MIDVSGKKCSRCAQFKSFDCFGKRKAMSDGHRSECKLCMAVEAKCRREADPEAEKIKQRRFYERHREARKALATRWRRENPERARETSLRSARLTGWQSQLSARAKATARAKGFDPLQPSLDRLDCSKGYTQDNVVLACQFANMGRSEMEAERFAAFVKTLSEHFLTGTAQPIRITPERVALRVA